MRGPHRRRPIVITVIFAGVVYVLMSVGIAVSTETKCRTPYGEEKHWVFAPPHWECQNTQP